MGDMFSQPAHIVAQNLIGCRFLVDGCGGLIVETEAYEADDPASHSFRGPTTRNKSMFGRPGTAYVYRSHGLHWCLNFVCTPGSAVLLRALEPRWQVDVMRQRRGRWGDPRELCSGPGKLTSALKIGGELDGLPLDRPPFELTLERGSDVDIVNGTRVGISRGTDVAWRFGLAGSPFLSVRFPRPPTRAGD
ncbi:DNA-3-methyladenine glycosylase [Aminobacter anthyllidis]|uniref:Putative 3-methyladenine DNA glycosylase n=1 Tax=Aminobacter anthyllidis TaxID=1035067 RepID=A0A9X1D8C1_9HYPH|nr:DNA-3-methyladenine glycosylase [Aminobacter anthyllidis]MBT1160172.1 DNA-3-methyladenine glycosylase [Aminobacter anthyllidis]